MGKGELWHGPAHDSLAEVSKIAGWRQLSIDPLLPDLGDPPESCFPPLIASGPDGRLLLARSGEHLSGSRRRPPPTLPQ